MRSSQFELIFKQLDLVQNSKEKLKTLTIEWETDLEKMNFALLRSTPECNIKNSYLDKLDTTINLEYCSDWRLNETATMELIQFVEAGNKIIPPLYVNSFEYDGETYTKKNISKLVRVDGSHRLFLSSYLGLKEIPIIVHEKIVKYYFPLSKWDFENTEEKLTVKSKDGNNIFEIEGRYVWMDDTMLHNNIIVVTA